MRNETLRPIGGSDPDDLAALVAAALIASGASEVSIEIINERVPFAVRGRASAQIHVLSMGVLQAMFPLGRTIDDAKTREEIEQVILGAAKAISPRLARE